MLLIGLTGGIASGKSFVAECFNAHGAATIDADQLAREVVEPGSDGLAALTAHFGQSILNEDGTLNRAALRKIIFSDPEERAFLNNTLHPRIRTLSELHIQSLSEKGQPYTLYMVPLLYETRQQQRFDRIAVVDVPVAVQTERLMQRDGSTTEQAQSMISAQATREQRLSIADDVIDNASGREHTRRQIVVLHQQYMALCTNTE